MIKKLVRHGNSYALIIDKAILDLLKITPDTPLEISTDGAGIFVTQPQDVLLDEGVSEKFEQSLDKINRRFADVLKRLA